MDYDVLIIGGGMSALAAGIRLAHYEKRVCIVERHSRIGGLNSFYSRGEHAFDVGLHAVTNYVGPKDKRAPLNKLLRQLRLRREDFALVEQTSSAIQFPDAKLTFTNSFADLEASIAQRFPDQIDGFRQLVDTIDRNDSLSLEAASRPTRPILRQHITDPLLRDMILCPLMYYGNAQEQDMEFNQFCILFQSIYQEGFCRPEGGVRQLLDVLEKRYRECGGELLLKCTLLCRIHGINNDALIILV